MTFLSRWTVIISLVISWTGSCFCLVHAAEDAIIAVVNDELITLNDLKNYAHATYASLITEGMSESHMQAVMKDLEENGIHKLIEDKLILSSANNIGLEVREELVDKRIAELEKKYGSEQNLVNALIKTGATLTDLRNKLREEMKLQFIVDHEIKSKIYVNPQEVTDYYEKNKEDFGRKRRVNLESIYIAYKGDEPAALAKAKNALTQIQEGKDFKEIAAQYSDSPSVGLIEEGHLLPSIEDAVFNLNIDEVSPLIETERGVYIFKLVGKAPAEIPDLADLKETIHDLLFKEKFRTRFIEWVDKLKKEAYIEIK
ncbi:MAG: peptidyl-prolyl cis-trans isomerase [Candidatus Omnitrophica bacterium]|nr:peptidyl-prolyl cis-trans isomerase [Candidatus Omnitrophota bacterium]